jgi:autotransporter-associated beta strand protein
MNGDVANIGTLSVTTTSSDSDISGVISTDTIVTKAGAGTLTLSGTNTYTGQTNVNAGTLAVTVNDALGTNAAGTVIASGATLDLQNVTYSTTEAITNNGGTLSTSTGTSAYAGTMTLGADSTIDVDGTQLTISTAIGDGGNGYAITKDGNGTLVLSATSTYTGDTTISAGTIKLTGNLNSATDLVIASGATLDLQAALTAATLDLDGTISNTAGTSSLVISGASSLGGSVTTTSTQTYTGAATLTGNSTLTTSSAQVTFSNTINSEGSETNNLTVTASELQLDGIVGGTRTLGVMDINGTLDLNAAITNATSIDVSSTSNLGANVTTSGTQTYTGATVLSTDVTLTTTNSNVTFSSTVDGDGTARDLTIDTNGNTGTILFDGLVGNSNDLDAMTITGNLDLDAAIANTTSISVSGTSNLGANVTTSGTQTYTGAVTLSGGDRTLTGST